MTLVLFHRLSIIVPAAVEVNVVNVDVLVVLVEDSLVL
jgi:hypothetical protein